MIYVFNKHCYSICLMNIQRKLIIHLWSLFNRSCRWMNFSERGRKMIGGSNNIFHLEIRNFKVISWSWIKCNHLEICKFREAVWRIVMKVCMWNRWIWNLNLRFKEILILIRICKRRKTIQLLKCRIRFSLYFH